MQFYKIMGGVLVVAGAVLAIQSIPSKAPELGVGIVLFLVGIIFIATAIKRKEL